MTVRLPAGQVVKGCWQLSGAHHGDRDSDRTAGKAALQDFPAFQAAGVTTLDVADHYGPGEELIGALSCRDLQIVQIPPQNPTIEPRFCWVALFEAIRRYLQSGLFYGLHGSTLDCRVCKAHFARCKPSA